MSLHGIKSIEIDDGKNVSNFFAVKIFLLNHLISKLIFSKFVRQKGKCQNRCFKKTKHTKFSQKRTFLTYVCVPGGKKCLFFGKFVLCRIKGILRKTFFKKAMSILSIYLHHLQYTHKITL